MSALSFKARVDPLACVVSLSVTSYSAIHKAAGLTVPGRSMILPGTIPENLMTVLFTKPPKSHSQKYWWQEQPPEAIPPLTASRLEWWNDGIVPGKSWNGKEPFVYSAISHEWSRQLERSLRVISSHSMILPGTIPENPISREWSLRLEQSLGWFQLGEHLAGGFVNSAVNVQYESLAVSIYSYRYIKASVIRYHWLWLSRAVHT